MSETRQHCGGTQSELVWTEVARLGVGIHCAICLIGVRGLGFKPKNPKPYQFSLIGCRLFKGLVSILSAS